MVSLLHLVEVGPAEEKEMIRHVAERDPHLFSIENPIITVANRSGFQSDHVASRIGFRETEGRELLALCLRYEVFLLLLLGTPTEETHRVETDVDTHRDSQKGVAGLELFADDAERDVIEPRSAILLRNADPHESQFGHLVEHGSLEVRFFIPLLDVRCDFPFDELSDSFCESYMIFAKLEINHGLCSTSLENLC